MIESDHAEERLARAERMLAQCRRESAALKAVLASKVVVIVVDAAPSLEAKHAVVPPNRNVLTEAVALPR
jgi:hypothetical protein